MTFAIIRYSFRGAVALAALALAACAPLTVVQPQFLHPGFAIESVGREGAVVAVDSDPTMLASGFRHALRSAYGSHDSLSMSLARNIAKGLKGPSFTLRVSRQTALSLERLSDTAHAARNAEFLRSMGAKYLVHVRELVISEKTAESTDLSGDDVPELTAVVLMKVDVWDTEGGGLLASFETDGEAGVGTFWPDPEGALTQAVKTAAAWVKEYLRTGRSEL